MRFKLIFLLSLFCLEAVQAETVLRLEDVLKLSLKANPDIYRLDANLATKLAAATEAQILKNPEVDISYLPEDKELHALGVKNEVEIELSQSFRISHFGLRQAYTTALKTSASLEQQAEIFRVLNDTVLLYYKTWLLQKQETALVNFQKETKTLLQYIEQSLKNQETPQLEGNLFQAEIARWDAELKITQAAQQEAQIELLRAIGSPWQKIKLIEPRLKPISTNLFQLAQFAQTRASLQKRILAQQHVAQRRYDIARWDIFPELSPRFIYATATDGSEDKWGVGLSFSLPVWDWNQAEIKKSRTEKKIADSEANTLDRATFDRLIEIRMKKAVALEEKSQIYWNIVLPTYQKSFQNSHQLYEQGQFTLFQLWEIQQKLFESFKTALQSTVESLSARTLLEQTIGGKLEEVSFL